MKKYPSSTEIAEMKARGYDQMTIREAEERAARWPAAQKICEHIQKAFQGVRLGNGVGLREAQGLDDHADDATRAKYRREDEKEDWRRISPDTLNGYSSSLSFFDAEGMRFHLPAFLIGDLLGTYGCGVIFHLTYRHQGKLLDHTMRRFTLLSGEQRRAVRDYLLFALGDPNDDFDRPNILKALEDYWIEPPS